MYDKFTDVVYRRVISTEKLDQSHLTKKTPSITSIFTSNRPQKSTKSLTKSMAHPSSISATKHVRMTTIRSSSNLRTSATPTPILQSTIPPPPSTIFSSSNDHIASNSPTELETVSNHSSISNGVITGISISAIVFISAVLFFVVKCYKKKAGANEHTSRFFNTVSTDANPTIHGYTTNSQSYQSEKPLSYTTAVPRLISQSTITQSFTTVQDPVQETFTSDSFDYVNNPFQQPINTFTVVSTFIPNLDDELNIMPGDRVKLLIEYDDGWCFGINETRGNIEGVFPIHCIYPISSEVNVHATPSAVSGGDHCVSKRRSSALFHD
ncbi:hypothetical protein BDF14DRAFT_1800586 [Spinellus fusiger]|nr:hypothetical protein BDF14DRAFT_1800586 [Spinellus fusiger]